MLRWIIGGLKAHIWFVLACVIFVTSATILMRSRNGVANDETRPRRVLTVVLGALGAVTMLVIEFVDADLQWLWLAAIIPTYFAVQHGINTAILKNPRFFDPSQTPDLGNLDDLRVVAAVRKNVDQERRLYSTPSLALRFLLPGIMIMIAVLAIGDALLSPTAVAGLDARFVQGARIGALGAYVYVVVYVGARTMRSDTTPAALLWALATMVSGPVFAGTLQLVVQKAPVDLGKAGWNDLIFPFAAGFSLRLVVNFVNASLRRLFTDPVINARGESLLRVRGITYDIEERLIEEGIEDVATLADANPVRLHRNMRFDRRQIISWIDEALLMKYLPNTWQSLENDGITGAIDLVWYIDHYGGHAIEEAARGADSLSPAAMVFKKLADRNKIDVGALSQIVLRMYSDGQVLLIWGLYQLEDGPAEPSPRSRPRPPALPAASDAP